MRPEELTYDQFIKYLERHFKDEPVLFQIGGSGTSIEEPHPYFETFEANIYNSKEELNEYLEN